MPHLSDQPETAEERRRKRRIVDDGEYLSFEVALMDGAPSRSTSTVFLTNSGKCAPADVPTGLAMRRHRLETAYLGDQAPAFPARKVPSPAGSPTQARQPAPKPAPTPSLDRSAIAEARRAWLADKETAHCRAD